MSTGQYVPESDGCCRDTMVRWQCPSPLCRRRKELTLARFPSQALARAHSCLSSWEIILDPSLRMFHCLANLVLLKQRQPVSEPQSFRLPFVDPLTLPSSLTVQANIGHVSPEIANAFPRKYGPAGLTIRESIYTGFDSIFSYRKPTPERLAQLDDLITSFNDPLFTPTFLDTTLFVDLKPGEQSLVLLLRALVKRPKLLVLDEPFAGMDKVMVDRVKKYLDEGLGEEQAVILISHFDEELPESVDRGLKLEKGKVVETW